MLARLVHKVKHLILCNFSLFFEFIGIAAKSSELAGTFNGEEFQFYSKFFDSAKKLIVLDIGANSGDWALKFMSNLGLKEIIIHAVEPIPDFAKQISQLNDPRIYLHNFAVGITSESLKIARVGGGVLLSQVLMNIMPNQIRISRGTWSKWLLEMMLLRK